MKKTQFTIYPIYLGEVISQEKSFFTYMVDPGTKTTCPFFAFLLLGQNGHKILVDTGASDEEWAEKYHSKITVPDKRTIISVLQNVFSLTPDDIDYIINTHLHWDHAWGNHLFPGKKIYVQERELTYALNPLPIHYSQYEAVQIGIEPNWYKTKDQFCIVDGDVTLEPGLELVLLPGHSEGLQGVIVNTSGGEYLLASDCINLYENWNGNSRNKHIIGGIHSDVKEYFRTYEKIEGLVKNRKIKIIPGHDPLLKSIKAFPKNSATP